MDDYFSQWFINILQDLKFVMKEKGPAK